MHTKMKSGASPPREGRTSRRVGANRYTQHRYGL